VHQYLPFIVLVVDEFADLDHDGGQRGRNAHINALASTGTGNRYSPDHRHAAASSVNIITGTSYNFPARIALK
jgi:DNA segregation ATPase FtsK/SpoIIIE-like protein